MRVEVQTTIGSIFVSALCAVCLFAAALKSLNQGRGTQIFKLLCGFGAVFTVTALGSVIQAIYLSTHVPGFVVGITIFLFWIATAAFVCLHAVVIDRFIKRAKPQSQSPSQTRPITNRVTIAIGVGATSTALLVVAVGMYYAVKAGSGAEFTPRLMSIVYMGLLQPVLWLAALTAVAALVLWANSELRRSISGVFATIVILTVVLLMEAVVRILRQEGVLRMPFVGFAATFECFNVLRVVLFLPVIFAAYPVLQQQQQPALSEERTPLYTAP